MLGFEFDANVANIRCVLLHQEKGKLFDPVAPGWIDAPADGSIPQQCGINPSQFRTQGKLKGLWRLPLSVDPPDFVGASLAVYASDGNGVLGDRLAYFGSPFTMEARYVQGFFNRSV